MKPLATECLGLSHIGYVREENQDVWQAHEQLGLFLLADGMGGRNAGLLAATLAVNETAEALSSKAICLPHDEEEAISWVKEAIEQANHVILKRAESDASCAGMGTTLVLLWILPDYAVIAHVGDSRIYRWRDRHLHLLTADHVMYSQSQEGLKVIRPMLAKAVGITSYAHPTLCIIKHQPGDLYLLCSDGLTGGVSDIEMSSVLQQHTSLEIQASTLMQAALNQGGRDNITIVMVRV